MVALVAVEMLRFDIASVEVEPDRAPTSAASYARAGRNYNQNKAGATGSKAKNNGNNAKGKPPGANNDPKNGPQPRNGPQQRNGPARGSAAPPRQPVAPANRAPVQVR